MEFLFSDQPYLAQGLGTTKALKKYEWDISDALPDSEQGAQVRTLPPRFDNKFNPEPRKPSQQKLHQNQFSSMESRRFNELAFSNKQMNIFCPKIPTQL